MEFDNPESVKHYKTAGIKIEKLTKQQGIEMRLQDHAYSLMAPQVGSHAFRSFYPSFKSFSTISLQIG